MQGGSYHENLTLKAKLSLNTARYSNINYYLFLLIF